jgi:dTDP-4-amino-4,6-dideoxyglucose
MNMPIVKPVHPSLSSFETEFKVALTTGVLTNNGPYVQEFERRLTEYLGVPTICFNNGTSALIAMLMAVDVQNMDVILPSFTYVATPHAVIMAGGRPIFADINEKTLCLDHDDAERRITGRTTAILGVDPFGIPWEPPKFLKDGDIDILIDSAPSFGSPSGDPKKPAVWADRGKAHVYSFHATKPFSTMEGGCLCSSDEELIQRAKAIRNFGIGPDGKVESTGINGKMTEICAIVGLKQLGKWPQRLASRAKSVARMHEALDSITGFRAFEPHRMQSWTYYPVFIKPEFMVARDTVVEKLHERGIMVRKYYEPCHLQPAYLHNPKSLSSDLKLTVTEHVAAQIIALPVYDELTDGDAEQIAEAFKAIQRGES